MALLILGKHHVVGGRWLLSRHPHQAAKGGYSATLPSHNKAKTTSRYLEFSGRCSTSICPAGRPMSKCCSRTCCRNSDTWDCRSSFSCRSRRWRASHFSSSLVRWMRSAAAVLLPGGGNILWLEIKLGTGCCEADGWCNGGWTTFGVWAAEESFGFSAGK